MQKAVDFRVIGLAVAAALLVGLAAQARTPARAIVAGVDLGVPVRELETRAGKNPSDGAALVALVSAYLERNAPGLAQAALEHAPAVLRSEPRVADLRVRTLILLGRVQLAFATQSALLVECSRRNCGPELEGRGRHRLAWLRELLQLEVADPREEPERANLAYRLASRQVQLELH